MAVVVQPGPAPSAFVASGASQGLIQGQVVAEEQARRQRAEELQWLQAHRQQQQFDASMQMRQAEMQQRQSLFDQEQEGRRVVAELGLENQLAVLEQRHRNDVALRRLELSLPQKQQQQRLRGIIDWVQQERFLGENSNYDKDTLDRVYSFAAGPLAQYASRESVYNQVQSLLNRQNEQQDFNDLFFTRMINGVEVQFMRQPDGSHDRVDIADPVQSVARALAIEDMKITGDSAHAMQTYLNALRVGQTPGDMPPQPGGPRVPTRPTDPMQGMQQMIAEQGGIPGQPVSTGGSPMSLQVQVEQAGAMADQMPAGPQREALLEWQDWGQRYIDGEYDEPPGPMPVSGPTAQERQQLSERAAPAAAAPAPAAPGQRMARVRRGTRGYIVEVSDDGQGWRSLPSSGVVGSSAYVPSRFNSRAAAMDFLTRRVRRVPHSRLGTRYVVEHRHGSGWKRLGPYYETRSEAEEQLYDNQSLPPETDTVGPPRPSGQSIYGRDLFVPSAPSQATITPQ